MNEFQLGLSPHLQATDGQAIISAEAVSLLRTRDSISWERIRSQTAEYKPDQLAPYPGVHLSGMGGGCSGRTRSMTTGDASRSSGRTRMMSADQPMALLAQVQRPLKVW